MNKPVRVAKVGGSLLRDASAAGRLKRWVGDACATNDLLLIAGGGMVVDQLRERWGAGEIGSIDAHWEAIEIMDRNTRSLAQQLNFPVVYSPLTERTGTDFLLVSDFLRESEPRLPGTPLPIGWEVTSDSIAARIAGLLDAGLVLLKSTPPPVSGVNVRALADADYVDEFFPTASVGLREVLFQTL